MFPELLLTKRAGSYPIHNFMKVHRKNIRNCPYTLYTILYTVFPRIVRARSINFTAVMLRGQFEGALYSRARFNTD